MDTAGNIENYSMKWGKNNPIRRMRVCFEYADASFLYVRIKERDNHLKVRYGVLQVNEEFSDAIPLFWPGAQLNLLDVYCESEDVVVPSFIVLEPDYLLDISMLADCYRDYGNHPANYLMSRLMPIENTRPLLLGNIANLFLDEWIYADEQKPDFRECMKKAFKQYPVELAVCEDIQSIDQERQFAADCRMHFEHIRQTIEHTFADSVYRLDKSDAVLEPSYICEPLGIQGRLDYMQRDLNGFIEMKSGKADEYMVKGKIVPKTNHRVQMLLYMAVLEYCMNYSHQQQRPYLFYTRYPLLYPARSSWAQVRRIIHLRNMIVASEYGVQFHNNPSYTMVLLSQIHPDTLNMKGMDGRLWSEFLAPQIQLFQNRLSGLDGLEKTYFYTLYNFITKELYLSKTGRCTPDGNMGGAAMWLNSLEEKREAGEVLYDLRILENKASQPHKASIRLSIPCKEDDFLPNFRIGDVVILYERNQVEDNATNKMVFKGSIESIKDEEVCIRLRAAQRNLSVFPPHSLYAIEHDTMDVTFRYMYYGLSAFMTANPDRKALLTGQRLPRFDTIYDTEIAHSIDDFERVALKAKAAIDYFLLVGPPGTGKTSRALRRMVEMFHASPDIQILLLAYTNRAVDEICQSLMNIEPGIDYIRLGSELACSECYKSHLLENVLESCNTRAEVIRRMISCRVYVGTVATMSAKTELFKLKRFDVAIIDEATQILESQLLPVLCEKSIGGADAVGKFILIGDHKQLPAVVLQDSVSSEVHDEGLREMGLLNLKDSLFERLYRKHQLEENSRAVDMLCRQGRMHPLVAEFSNQAFYANKLQIVGLPHQNVALESAVFFASSAPDYSNMYGKTNQYEASIVADWAVQIWNEDPENFNPYSSLGIVTPYRNQIALIRKEIHRRGVAALEQITIDTVERYQGSERDVILYSFCINRPEQLKLLPNLVEENGVWIDRKLNVALTRARKRLYVTGVPELLRQNEVYKRFLSYLIK